MITSTFLIALPNIGCDQSELAEPVGITLGAL